MTPLIRTRSILALGKRAIEYYIETGCCFFCEADDVEGRPHEPGCTVGELSGVVVTPERVAEKRWQREIVGKWAEGTLTREELYSSGPGVAKT